MNLIATLDLAIEIERALSESYMKVCELFADEPICGELEKLGREEIGHMNLIRTGKSYALKAPEAFPRESDFYEEMKRGLVDGDRLHRNRLERLMAGR